MTGGAQGIRSFISIHPPPAVLRRLENFQDELRQSLPGDAVRWTRPDQIHLTLRFLGDVPEADLPELETALRRACAHTASFVLRATAAGCFPDTRRPRIIWVGLGGALEALAQLHESIARETQPWGEREDRDFRAHLTLGRVKRPDPRLARALASRLDRAGRLEFGEWRVAEVMLMRSDLSQAGPRHQTLAGISLATASAEEPADSGSCSVSQVSGSI